MRRAACGALVAAWVVLTVWSAARADITISTVHPDPRATIEAELDGLGIVQLERIDGGTVAGIGWARWRVLAEAASPASIRVRARTGAGLTPWSEWYRLEGEPSLECAPDTGAIGVSSVGWLLGRLYQPGQLCIRRVE